MPFGDDPMQRGRLARVASSSGSDEVSMKYMEFDQKLLDILR